MTIDITDGYGKPRPALVIQDDAFRALPSLVVLRVTSNLHDSPLFRISVEPDAKNGLRLFSYVIVDKPVTVPRSKIGQRIGRLDPKIMITMDAALMRFVGLG